MVKIGLALGGGSSKGLAHIGVLKALEEENIQISFISGTSMGAIIGAVYASSGNANRLREMAKKFTTSRAFKNFGLSVFNKDEEGYLKKIVHTIKEKLFLAETLFKSHFVEEEELKEGLKQIIPDIAIEDCIIPFSSVSLDLISGKDVIKKYGSLQAAVMTSMLIPGLFPYSSEGGYILVDGGSTSSVPVHAVKELGADIVIAVSLRGKLFKRKKLNTGLEIHLRIDDIVTTRLIETQTLEADVIIRPDVMNIHWTDFGKIDYCIKKGYESAMNAMPQIKKVIREKGSMRRKILKFFSKDKGKKSARHFQVVDS